MSTPSTARQDFIAAHPKDRAVQEAFRREFRDRFRALMTGLKSLLQAFVDKAENARQIGIVLIEFSESLPGKHLTRDFYEQCKRELFTDAQGCVVSFEHLEWFMRVARNNEMPIVDFRTAGKWSQPLLLACGEAEFALVAERPGGNRIPPKDDYTLFTEWMGNPAVPDMWTRLRANPDYCPDGHIRADLREVLREALAPQFKVMDEIRKELGL